MSVFTILLLDATLRVTLLCLAGFALATAARRRSPALRHDLWMGVLGCCALLPLAEIAMWLARASLPVAPVHQAVMAVTPSLPAAMPAGAIELVDRIWSGDGSGEGGWITVLILSLWLGGLAVAASRTIHAYRAAARLVRRAAPFVCAIGPADVRVLITAELSTPALFGLRAPAILLPADARNWSEARLRAVFAHEAAHVARRDCAVELVVQIALAFHWFNPLVWKAARALRAERELACDELALATGLDAHGYAAALVAVARAAFGAPQRALLAMARPPELERRVVRLLGPRRPAYARGPLRGAIAWSAIACFMLFAAVTAPASGLLGSGSVQPRAGPLSGLDDPMSERVPLAYERLAAQAAAVPAEGPERAAIAALQAQLGRTSQGYGDLVRERAIWALVQVQDGRLYAPLAQQAWDRDWRVRAYAAWALAVAGDRRATPLLAQLLDDPVWRVRAMAASALAGLADPVAADSVIEALEDPAWQVRLAAIDYVGRIGDRALAEHLRPLLHDPHTATRMHAEAVLSRF